MSRKSQHSRKSEIDMKSYEYRIGQNIRRIRLMSLELGQIQEADSALRVSRAYYWRIENGLSSISLATLRQLAKIFGVPITDFFIDENGKHIPLDAEETD